MGGSNRLGTEGSFASSTHPGSPRPTYSKFLGLPCFAIVYTTRQLPSPRIASELNLLRTTLAREPLPPTHILALRVCQGEKTA